MFKVGDRVRFKSLEGIAKYGCGDYWAGWVRGMNPFYGQIVTISKMNLECSTRQQIWLREESINGVYVQGFVYEQGMFEPVHTNIGDD